MSGEREKVLQMLEQGKISASETADLLDALGEDEPSDAPVPIEEADVWQFRRASWRCSAQGCTSTAGDESPDRTGPYPYAKYDRYFSAYLQRRNNRLKAEKATSAISRGE